uniref:Uncharacterized protein n=1 Tax=Lactuca sativa TaxID=4236 RepID=A0A9R1XQ25_LACSA|nr:hypothetical protein LSAT_V11C200094570 [Lactuca sativa]
MDNDSDGELVLHTLLSAAQDMIHERGESSHDEKKNRKWIDRDQEVANELLVRDYFAPDSLYGLSKFEESFRISRYLFLRIARDLEHARGKRGFTTIQKCTTALRQLAYDITADASDEYLKMSEMTGRECTYNFCEYVIELYRDIYLRHPTKSDVEQFLTWFSRDACIHWEWANCPNAWRGQSTRDDHGVQIVILEVVVSHDLCFWHAFFGMTRSNNDLNVLQVSPLFNNILQGKAPDMSYYWYYLVNGIYIEYATFVKSYSFTVDKKQKLFKLAQKDVDRAFGILKQK